jgi:hypoxanthine phosphoribosyltransferase
MEWMEHQPVQFSEETIKKRIQEIGAEITRDYAGMDLILISVLKG